MVLFLFKVLIHPRAFLYLYPFCFTLSSFDNFPSMYFFFKVLTFGSGGLKGTALSVFSRKKLLFIFENWAERACIYLYLFYFIFIPEACLAFMALQHTFTPGSGSIQMQASTVDRRAAPVEQPSKCLTQGHLDKNGNKLSKARRWPSPGYFNSMELLVKLIRMKAWGSKSKRSAISP